MKENELVDEYFARTLKIQIRWRHGERMKENIVKETMKFMNEKYDYVLCFIEESNNATIVLINDEFPSTISQTIHIES